MGLSFLSPWFLLGALAVALPVVLHLRKQDTAPAHAFAAIRFLRRAPVEARRPRQLRDLLLLALRVLALALLAAAFARPYVRGEDAVGGVTIVAVDASFSMGAPGRMQKAKDAALRAIGAAPGGDRLALIRVDDRATVLAEPSLDRGAARAAVASLAAGSGGTTLAPLWNAATRLAGAATGRLILISDLEIEHPAGAIAEGLTLEVVDVGGPVENLAVGPARRDADALVAEITNYGIRARRAQVVLAVNDRSVADAAVAIEPGRTASVRLPARLPTSGVARIAVTDTEGIPADDTRYLVLDAPPLADGRAPRRAGLGRRPLPAAFGHRVGRTGPRLRGRDARRRRAPRPGRRDRAGPPGDHRQRHARPHPRDATGAARLRPRRRRAVAAGERNARRRARWARSSATRGCASRRPTPAPSRPRCRPWTRATRSSPPSATPPAASAGPASRGRCGWCRGRAAASWRDSPMAWPALVEQPVGTGRIAVFASALGSEDTTAWNTFARQATFVPFVLETLHYLAGPAGSAGPSELVVADAPEAARGRPGVVRAGNPPRPLAVNVDLRESGAPRREAGGDRRRGGEGRTGATRADRGRA